MFKIYYDQEEIKKTIKLQEVDTFLDLVAQRKLVKVENVQNHINIEDYIPKPVNSMSKKLAKGIGSRVSGVADRVGYVREAITDKEKEGLGEIILNSPTGSQNQQQHVEETAKNIKNDDESESKSGRIIMMEDHQTMIKKIELQLLQKEINSIIVEKIKNSPEASPKNSKAAAAEIQNAKIKSKQMDILTAMGRK